MAFFHLGKSQGCLLHERHRRRIRTEEKAMVVDSVWGKEFIQLFATLAVLPRTILKNRMNLSFSFKSSWCNLSYNSTSSFMQNS